MGSYRNAHLSIACVVLACLFTGSFCSYADHPCAIVSVRPDPGAETMGYSGRAPAWSREVQRQEDFVGAVYGSNDLVCGNETAPEFSGRYVVVDSKPCSKSFVKQAPSLDGYYKKAKRIQDMGGVGMIVSCPDDEKICQNFGQDKDFEEFSNLVDIEIVSTNLPKSTLDSMKTKTVETSLYNPPIPLITSSTFALSMIVVVVIIIASVWSMPEPPEAGDKEFGFTTVFIYGYALYLSFKHGYKAKDLLDNSGSRGGGISAMGSDGASLLPDSAGSGVTSTSGGSAQKMGGSGIKMYLCMFLTMSTILMVVFFFRAYFIGFIIFMFSVGGSLSLSRVLQSITYTYAPHLFDKKVTYTLLREEEFRVMSWAFSGVCLLVGISWFAYRAETWNVVMHDIFSACICIGVLHNLYVPNMRVMAIVYGVGIAYDVFWTFITPAIFGNSVMVQVATGETNTDTCLDIGVVLPLQRTTNVFKSLPFLMELPRPCDDWSCARSSVVGLGDILIPGLMLVFCAKLDTSGGRVKFSSDNERHISGNLYFFTAVLAYVLGLIWTFCSYVIMQGHGQPALMFILPSLYCFISAVAFAKGEFHILWNGPSDDPAGYKSAATLDGGATQELEPLEEGLLEEATPIL